jgi:acyl-CoA hydrolase
MGSRSRLSAAAENSMPPNAVNPDRPARRVSESAHETTALMMPPDENARGHVFGGVVLAMMDKAAAVCAIRHARTSCVTISVDRVDFREPILVGDLVHMKASVNFVGRSSMEIGVRIEAENMLLGTRRHTNSCYVTYVALDREGKPTEVPTLILETETERRRFAAGGERRRRREEERAHEKTKLDESNRTTSP